MRVVATKDFKAYLNYQSVSIPEGHVIRGSTAAYLLSTGAPVKRIDEEALSERADANGPSAELDLEGTAEDILAWVGENPDRASEALEMEQAKDKPRSTLVKKLQKLADTE